MDSKRGKYIIFESGEGCGKGIQTKLLKRYFDELGIPCIIVREPGGTPEAEVARQILLNPKYTPSERTELFLMEAARVDLFIKKILPALEKGINVIADRSYVASWVYQGYTRGLDINFVEKANKFATFNTKGDLIFIIDNDPKIGLANITKHNRLDRENLAFHKKVRKGYLKFAKENENCVVISYRHGDVQGIQEEIKNMLKKD